MPSFSERVDRSRQAIIDEQSQVKIMQQQQEQERQQFLLEQEKKKVELQEKAERFRQQQIAALEKNPAFQQRKAAIHAIASDVEFQTALHTYTQVFQDGSMGPLSLLEYYNIDSLPSESTSIFPRSKEALEWKKQEIERQPYNLEVSTANNRLNIHITYRTKATQKVIQHVYTPKETGAWDDPIFAADAGYNEERIKHGNDRRAGLAIEIIGGRSEDDDDLVFYSLDDFLDFLADTIAGRKKIIFRSIYREFAELFLYEE